jgi:uncharacterized protein (TIGR02145 family)
MEKTKFIITSGAVLILLFSNGNMSGNFCNSFGSNPDKTSSESAQTQTKSTQTTTKSAQTTTKSTKTSTKSSQTKSKSIQKSTKSEPVPKAKDPETVTIGTQTWAIANLNVSTFRNGDSIPEARSNKEWVAAGESRKPAWCYYNNDPANGPKYGKLYNWYAVIDPRGLAPAGWTLSSEKDWAELVYILGGPSHAGSKLKSATGWSEGDNGKNEAGFSGFPGGYRIENGLFQNVYTIATWWSSTESSGSSAIDCFITLAGNLSKSSTPKQRGQSVRCLRTIN